jgi:hypothetical protein
MYPDPHQIERGGVGYGSALVIRIRVNSVLLSADPYSDLDQDPADPDQDPSFKNLTQNRHSTDANPVPDPAYNY